MSIMKEEPVGVIARYRFSELLHRPIGRRPGRSRCNEDAAGADLHDHEYIHEYIEDREAGSDRHHRVASHQGSRMIADKRVPVLRSETRMAPFALCGPVRSNRPRRNADTKLQPELIGDALFAPGRIVKHHSRDHLLKLGRQPRTTDATRLPLPKQSERVAMPTDQRCRLNNEKSGFPLQSELLQRRFWVDSIMNMGSNELRHRSDLIFAEDRPWDPNPFATTIKLARSGPVI